MRQIEEYVKEAIYFKNEKISTILQQVINEANVSVDGKHYHNDWERAEICINCMAMIRDYAKSKKM